MEKVIIGCKSIITVAGGLAAYLVGGLDGLLKGLIALMAIDYATGIMCGWVAERLSSNTGFRGIVKKVAQLGTVAMAYIIQRLTGGALPLRELTIMFFVANEGLSILENMARMGVPFPERLKKALIQLKEAKNGAEADPADQ